MTHIEGLSTGPGWECLVEDGGHGGHCLSERWSHGLLNHLQVQEDLSLMSWPGETYPREHEDSGASVREQGSRPSFGADSPVGQASLLPSSPGLSFPIYGTTGLDLTSLSGFEIS